MASLAYNHGVIVTESAETPVLPRYNRFGVVGVIGTAEEADISAFPLNRPVLLIASRYRSSTIGATGTLPHALETLVNEGASHIIVVRAPEGVDASATRANIIGNRGAKTGLYAFLDAKHDLDLKPRILIAPGFTNAFTNDGVVNIALSNGGTGYTNETISVSLTRDPGDAPGEVDAVLGDPVIVGGVIQSIPILIPGTGYTADPTLVITDSGTGTGALGTASVGDVMNPVTATLAQVANDRQVTARAYVDGPNTTDVEAVAYRNTINNGRVLVIDPAVLQYDPATDTAVARSAATVFAGVRARVATERNISESVSNKEMRTVLGAARTVRYGDEANYLNERQVATIIKYRGGFRTWGSRLATSDTLWQFDSVRATADFINETIEDTIFEFVDRRFSEANLKFLLQAVRAILTLLEANGDILPGSGVAIDRSRSTNEELASGRIWLRVWFEPPAIMEDIRVITNRNIAAYEVLLDRIGGVIDEGTIAVAA